MDALALAMDARRHLFETEAGPLNRNAEQRRIGGGANWSGWVELPRLMTLIYQVGAEGVAAMGRDAGQVRSKSGSESAKWLDAAVSEKRCKKRCRKGDGGS